MTQEQIQLLRVHRRHQRRLTDRSHTTVAEARPYDYDAGSQPTQPGSRARETRSREVVAALPLWFAPMPLCSDSALAHFLSRLLPLQRPAPVFSLSLVRWFVCFGFSPARESCSAELLRALLPFGCCSASVLSYLPRRTRRDGVRRAAFMAGDGTGSLGAAAATCPNIYEPNRL